ncbi:hypothetical protein MIMGU_mgv1a024806mg, partial [Erythranthe guttata]
ESEAMRRHVIKIFNRMPEGTPAITVHCASKNDDLGYRLLYTGQDFNWSFRNNFWRNTLFFCRFSWGQKTIAFDVYNDHWGVYHHTFTYAANIHGVLAGFDETPTDNMVLVQAWP